MGSFGEHFYTNVFDMLLLKTANDTMHKSKGDDWWAYGDQNFLAHHFQSSLYMIGIKSNNNVFHKHTSSLIIYLSNAKMYETANIMSRLPQ